MQFFIVEFGILSDLCHLFCFKLLCRDLIFFERILYKSIFIFLFDSGLADDNKEMEWIIE
jgi:hypothetical protein